MNLTQDITEIWELLGPRLTREQVVKLSIDMAQDMAVFPVAGKNIVTDPIQEAVLNTPILEASQVAKETQRWNTLLLSRLHNAGSKCQACGRCQRRTQVVPGEGPLEALLFLVVENATWVDDRTGMPLSSLMEIKTSGCSDCKTYNVCYSEVLAGKANPSPQQACIPTREITLEPRKERLLDSPRTGVRLPGAILTQALLKAGLNRTSWHEYTALRGQLGLGSRSPEPANVYVTNLVRCYNGTKPTAEEIAACNPWLLLERKLCSAPVTIALGLTVAQTIIGKPIENYPSLIGKHRVVEGWGTVYFLESPEDYAALEFNAPAFLVYQENLLRTFTEALATARKLRAPKTAASSQERLILTPEEEEDPLEDTTT